MPVTSSTVFTGIVVRVHPRLAPKATHAIIAATATNRAINRSVRFMGTIDWACLDRLIVSKSEGAMKNPAVAAPALFRCSSYFHDRIWWHKKTGCAKDHVFCLSITGKHSGQT